MNDIADCVSIEASPAVPLDLQRCQFSFADGRRCRSPRGEAHPKLCVSNARSKAKPAQAANLADEPPPPGHITIGSNLSKMNTYAKCATNPCRMRTSKIIGLKAGLYT